MFRLLLVIVAFIVYGSLYPFQFDFDRTDASPLWILLHAWPAHFDKFAWRDAGVNLALYFPLGISAYLAMARRIPRAIAAFVSIALGVLLSASVEMLQVFDGTRTCSLVDLACNTIGAAGGAAAGLILHPELMRTTQSRKSKRGAAGALLLAAAWAGYQLYPFVPLFSRGRLRANFERFLHAPFSGVEVFASMAEWFAFALLMRSILGHFRAPWLALAMLCLPLRLLIVERSVAPAEILGAALALLLWTYPEEQPKLKAGAILLALTIVLREMEPFHFVRQVAAFSWIPFSATFGAERQNATFTLLRKSFEYGAMVWTLRGIGLRYANAGMAVRAALLLLELLQRHLPNRQPEITDALIAGLMACVLWATAGSSTRE